MAEYIEREATIASIENVLRERTDEKSSLAYLAFAMFTELLKIAPTADVVEVKHGEWQFNYNEHRHLTSCSCSVCKRSVKEHAPYIGYVICPYCGAKMDLKEGATNA